MYWIVGIVAYILMMPVVGYVWVRYMGLPAEKMGNYPFAFVVLFLGWPATTLIVSIGCLIELAEKHKHDAMYPEKEKPRLPNGPFR